LTKVGKTAVKVGADSSAWSSFLASIYGLRPRAAACREAGVNRNGVAGQPFDPVFIMK
jgi:hypothetical protein